MKRSLNSTKQEIFGFIAAMRTLLDNYPELQRNDKLLSLLNAKTPLEFLLGLAEMIGLSIDDLLNWISKILCGTEAFVKETVKNAGDNVKDYAEKNGTSGEGVLDTIETAVKIILLTNIKNLFSCSINPLIPYSTMKFPNDTILNGGGQGIKLSIPMIDVFNVLQQAPNSEYGKTLYFDNTMISNKFWQSTDFNCFMWYVINKGSTMENGAYKHVWDNRVKYRKKFANNNVFRDNFFDEFKGNGTLINKTTPLVKNEKYCSNEKDINKDSFKSRKKSGYYAEKKAYIILEYNETDPSMTVPNTLTLYINADRYLRKKYVNDTLLQLPKTVFEFNYDFIFSLKLFDSKVIVANVINAIMNTANAGIDGLKNVKYTLQEEAIAGKVGQIVKEVMEAEDTVIDDDFFSFSNDEYDNLLSETDIKYSENYQFGEVYGTLSQTDIENITNEINNIGNASTLNEQEAIIKNLFTNVAGTTASNGEISITDKFTLGQNIILNLLKESVIQIVLQILSPKVMILYALNSYFMGDAANGDFSKINVKNLLKGLTNLIIKIVKQVLDMLIKELLAYLLTELKELLNALLRKILLERIEYYLEILQGILNLIKTFYNVFTSGKKPDSIIDNVNFAEIVPQDNKPT